MTRFLIINHIHNAQQSLRSSRVRSALTMLGVTIGVASVTAILALGGGAGRVINDQINMLGGNIAVIRPGVTVNPINNITQPQNNQGYATSSLSSSDVKQLRKINHVKSVAPLMILSETIRADATPPLNTTILATTPELADISNLKLREGQFLGQNVDENSAVVGQQLSVNMFGTESSIGSKMTIHGQTFIVVGVLQLLNNPINYNSVDFDNTAIINYAMGEKINKNNSQIQQINVKADSIKNLKQVVKDINTVLLKNHEGEKDFSVLVGNQISQPTSQLFYSITDVTAAIAAISLFVGGIGIMNIMLVTVAERTREIGIRKALGASNTDIMYQFLIESLAISICGGIAGYVAGYGIAFIVSEFLALSPVVNWQVALIAMAISVFMGTLFGLYPAIRAARSDPIESLNRHS
ncbi:MAG TPA: ABC transporter permease [Candidatus Saccharimonadales bacterium]|nr:ABC transporter permease [Candidatus Saccharimonadales bacterium]